MTSNWTRYKSTGTFRRLVKNLRHQYFENDEHDYANTFSSPAPSASLLNETTAEIPLLTELITTKSRFSSSSPNSSGGSFPPPAAFENVDIDTEDSLSMETDSPDEDSNRSVGLDIDDDSVSLPMETYSPDKESDTSVGLDNDDDAAMAFNERSTEEFLREWATTYKIRHQALKPLIQHLNQNLKTRLPKDPRTLLGTLSTTCVVERLAGGEYWHQGIKLCLSRCFAKLDAPLRIEINVNIDGLPLYTNGRQQFWPILFNIHNLPAISPMVIALFYGHQKPSKVEEYLDRFTNELNDVLKDGIKINGFQLTVQLRAFICDSPARALIKGVKNFNAHHGCLKCCTVGRMGAFRCTTFHRTSAEKRTNEKFRAGEYVNHYNYYNVRSVNDKLSKVPVISPLLRLPIDIVQDVIISDSLHLLHLGVMRRLFKAYVLRDRYDGDAWTKDTASEISITLINQQMPMEIHKAVRGLSDLAHWKGSEFATMLNYIGVALLKKFLKKKEYKLFLYLFCGTTICSCNYFKPVISVAELCYNEFVRDFRKKFQSITSNIHNLVHIVDEVKRFGPLPTLTSYPFENQLYQIKRMLRSGRLPLQQVVRRISEQTMIVQRKPKLHFPRFKMQSKTDPAIFHHVVLRENCNFKTDFPNKWFLSRSKEVVAMQYASRTYGQIVGSVLMECEDVFKEPMPSSHLNIFQTCYNSKFKLTKSYCNSDILCKLVPVIIDEITTFVPMHHTYLKHIKL